MSVKDKLKNIKLIYYPYTTIKYGLQSIVPLKDIYFTKNRIIKKHNACSKQIRVIFIAQYIPGWNKLEPIYRKMMNDPRFDPLIVCVPLRIQGNELADPDDLSNDTYDYFVEHGYNAINALIGKNDWLDLKGLKPDFVFHSRPYNHFMPKQYTSKAIRKYALLCNILYGTNTTRNGQDVTINRDYFKDVFCFYAFDEYEKRYYENKFRLGTKLKIQNCFPYGAIGLEEILSFKNYEKLSQTHKRVLWTPRWSTDPVVGGSNFFRYKSTILNLVKSYPDVQFIFRPHPLMFDNFVKTGEMTKEEVFDFKRMCEATKNVVLDETKDYTKTFWETDFIIADPSGIIPEYYITNHPIIYCHSDIDFDYADYCREILSNSYEINNEQELIATFAQLYNNNDSKHTQREESINHLFGDVSHCSDSILESLVSKIMM